MLTNNNNNLHKIVINELPLIDLRSPIEYNKGAFINSVNLPLMNDEERHLVGIAYKEKGSDEAIALGHQLVSGNIRQERVNAWMTHINKYPNSLIYCYRGGLRSRISQQWILEATDKNFPFIKGGYKTFRNYLLSTLESSSLKCTPIILGGNTGSGKTILLQELENSIDLESIANHRGSAFGQYITPQPSQVNFENNLAYALIQHEYKGYNYMVIEDEGRNIGKCYLPKPLVQLFNSGQLVILDIPFEERANITFNEYVTQSQAKYRDIFGHDKGLSEWFNYMNSSIYKVRKRLGGDRHAHVMKLLDHAYSKQLSTGSPNSHLDWIKNLLRDYYDPMYQYQIQKTTKEIIYQGNKEEVLSFLSSLITMN